MQYVLDALEGLLGGFIFCFLGFGTGGGFVKAAHDLRMELKREQCSIGMCAVSVFLIAFWELATVFLFGLPVLVALEPSTSTEPLRLAVKATFYYVAGRFFYLVIRSEDSRGHGEQVTWLQSPPLPK